MPETDGPEVIVILAPTRRDAVIAAEVLQREGMGSRICADVPELCRNLSSGAAAALIAEELLSEADIASLRRALANQPAWSDLPILLLERRRRRDDTHDTPQLGNVTPLDAPLRRQTLVNAARTALRSRQRQYEARRAIEERDRFLAMLGHELRNPLSAIALALGLVDEDASSKPMQVIRRQVDQLKHLVDDLLDVSRVSSGKIELRSERLDLHDVLQRSLSPLRRRFADAGVALDVGIDEDACVVGDALRLEQIVANLLTNAVKYTPRGGHVSVELMRDDDEAVLHVTDDGVGITADETERIFEPFFQAKSTLARSEGGMGIGLSLVRRLVELHGGEVNVESEGIDRGSRFTVRLPLAPATDRVDADQESRSDAREAGTPREVVVIEDNADTRTLLVTLLEMEGHTVHGAADGREGLDLLLASSPDAAIVDLGLPVLDGYEVARRARAALGEQIVLVALTGYGQGPDRERAFEAGFDRHMTKPADLDALRRLLDTAPSKLTRQPGTPTIGKSEPAPR